MMYNNHIHPRNKFLKFYDSCPLAWAKNEYNISKNHRYEITTIDWNSPTNKLTGEKLYDFVHRNTYEVTLEEFLNWFVGLTNEEIVSIEKISE